jgi:hypothetical protein
MTKLSTESECAWLDWLDAFVAAKESDDPADRERADRCWNDLMATFLPAEFREWGKELLKNTAGL